MSFFCIMYLSNFQQIYVEFLRLKIYVLLIKFWYSIRLAFFLILKHWILWILSSLFFFQLKVTGCLSGYLQLRISLTFKLTWFSFTVQPLLSPGKDYSYFGKSTFKTVKTASIIIFNKKKITRHNWNKYLWSKSKQIMLTLFDGS